MGRNHPYLIGLTGSIGMGKSTVADFFALEGAAIWDADAAVHGLYGSNQPGSLAIAQLFPEAVGRDGVDRKELAVAIAADPSLLPRIEAAIHPLVAADRQKFIDTCKSDIAVLDIPLLFETGASDNFDLVIVVAQVRKYNVGGCWRGRA